MVGRNLEALEDTGERCRAKGAEVSEVVADLMDPASLLMISSAVRAWDGEIVLVNAAGVASFGDFVSQPWTDVAYQIDMNLLVPMRLCHTLLPLMLDSGSGQIINVLSIAATHAFSGATSYGASKAGLLAAGRNLAAEYRRQGIRVTALLPGATDTPIWDGQGFVPPRAEMLTAEAVGQAIADLVRLPPDRVVDELTLMPPKGIL